MGEAQEKLPVGWARTTLGNVLELKYGKSLTAKQRDNTGHSVYGSNGVVGQHSVPLTNGTTLIIGRKGSIGETHLSLEKCWPIDTTYFIDEFHGQPASFWAYLIKTLRLVELNRATALPGLNRNDVYQISISLPPLNEQKRIVSKIEGLQAHSNSAREALETIPDLLEQLRQSILSAAFRGDLTKSWREKNSKTLEPATELLKRIRAERRKRWEESELEKLKAKGLTGDKLKDEFAKRKKKYKEPEPVDTSGLPELPEGWCWASLAELSSAVKTISYGVLQPGEEIPDGVQLVRVCDLQDGMILSDQLRTISPAIDMQYERTRLKGGELLVSVVGTIGRTTIVPKKLAGVNIARAVARIVTLELVNKSWLQYVLSTPFLQDFLVRGAREVARKTLNISVLERAPIPLSSSEEMEELTRKIAAKKAIQDSIRATLSQSDKDLDQIERTILSKAFQGKLVPQDPNDEPASTLLKRILEQTKGQFVKTTKKKQKGRLLMSS